MIIQTAPTGKPHLVILQTDHYALMSGAFAAAFGSRRICSIESCRAMIYAAGHHDEGWAPIDARVEQDPAKPVCLIILRERHCLSCTNQRGIACIQ